MIETKSNQIAEEIKFENIVKQLAELPPDKLKNFCFWAHGYIMDKNQAS